MEFSEWQVGRSATAIRRELQPITPPPEWIFWITRLLAPTLRDEVFDDLERRYYRDLERGWTRFQVVACCLTSGCEAILGSWFNLDRLQKIANIIAAVRKPTVK
jgi:hypothetical protein